MVAIICLFGGEQMQGVCCLTEPVGLRWRDGKSYRVYFGRWVQFASLAPKSARGISQCRQSQRRPDADARPRDELQRVDPCDSRATPPRPRSSPNFHTALGDSDGRTPYCCSLKQVTTWMSPKISRLARELRLLPHRAPRTAAWLTRRPELGRW